MSVFSIRISRQLKVFPLHGHVGRGLVFCLVTTNFRLSSQSREKMNVQTEKEMYMSHIREPTYISNVYTRGKTLNEKVSKNSQRTIIRRK